MGPSEHHGDGTKTTFFSSWLLTTRNKRFRKSTALLADWSLIGVSFWLHPYVLEVEAPL
jgi:hypothetical protein